MTSEHSPTVSKQSRGRRLRWILFAGGVLVGVVLAYVHFYLYLPIGSGPAGPAVEVADLEEPWTERQVLLVGIGDSVTAGLGSTHGKSYFDRLVSNPSDEFADMQGRNLSRVLPNLTTLNIALSGSNSQHHVEHIEQKLPMQEEATFGLVVMTTGGNDLIHWYGRTPPREGAMYGATLAEAQPWISNYEIAWMRCSRDRSEVPGRLSDLCRRHLRSLRWRGRSGEHLGPARLARLPGNPRSLQRHSPPRCRPSRERPRRARSRRRSSATAFTAASFGDHISIAAIHTTGTTTTSKTPTTAATTPCAASF